MKWPLVCAIVFVLSVCGCIGDKTLSENSSDCSNYQVFAIYDGVLGAPPSVIAELQEKLANNDFSDWRLWGMFLWFQNPDFTEYNLKILCNKDCSLVSCEYNKILISGKLDDCAGLPENTTIELYSPIPSMGSGGSTGYFNTTVNFRETCRFYKTLQAKFDEPGFCDKIPSSNLKDDCTTQAALNGGWYFSKEYCEKLSKDDGNYRTSDNCFWKLARVQNDREICRRIDDSEYSIQCLDEFNNTTA